MHYTSTPTCINFLSRFKSFNFFHYHGLKSMVEKKNFKVEISPKPERPHPPKLVRMHYTSTPTCIKFLSRFKSIQFFHYHGLKSMVEKKNFKVEISPKPERPHPPKLVRMHYTSTPTCINFLSRFKSFNFFHYHGLKSMVKKKNFKVEISPKPERPHPPKLVRMHYTSTPTCIKFLS